jgi:hypothetical protein
MMKADDSFQNVILRFYNLDDGQSPEETFKLRCYVIPHNAGKMHRHMVITYVMGKIAVADSPQGATLLHRANNHSDFNRFFVFHKSKGFLAGYITTT